jgi:hypothetical protein
MAIKYSSYDSSSGNIFSLTTITGQSGVFTSQLSGAYITGITIGAATGVFTTSLTAGGIDAISITGVTVKGISGVFTSVISGNEYRASGNVAVITGSGDVRPYGLYSFPATTGVSGQFLKTNANGTTDWAPSVSYTITISTGDPSGGNDGDIWIKYTP